MSMSMSIVSIVRIVRIVSIVSIVRILRIVRIVDEAWVEKKAVPNKSASLPSQEAH